MRLTQWSDYSLRVLMYCAASAGRDTPVTITEIAQAHAISRSHLTKIVMMLAAQGWLETTRGHGGGLRLAPAAATLSVGEVLRLTETDFALVECFDTGTNACRIDRRCRLKGALARALERFLAELDDVPLADLVQPAGALPAAARPRTPGRAARVPLRLSPALPSAPAAAARRRR